MLGIEIKGTPAVKGGHNGNYKGKEYFQCDLENHGLFVTYNEVKRNIPPEEILDKLAYIYDELRELQSKFAENEFLMKENAAAAAAIANNNNNNNDHRNGGRHHPKLQHQQSEYTKECYVNAVTFIGDMFAGAVHETPGDRNALSLKFKQFVLQLLVFQLESTHRTPKPLMQQLRSQSKIDTKSIPGYIKKLTYSYCMNVKQIAPVFKYFNFDFLDEHLNTSNHASDKKCYQFVKDFLCYKHVSWIKLEVMLGLFPNLTTVCLAGVVLKDDIFETILKELTALREAEEFSSDDVSNDDNNNNNNNKNNNIRKKKKKDDESSGFYRPEHHRILFANTSHMLTKIEIIGPEMGIGQSEMDEVSSSLIDSIVDRFSFEFENIDWCIKKSSNKWNNEWVSISNNDFYE